MIIQILRLILKLGIKLHTLTLMQLKLKELLLQDKLNIPVILLLIELVVTSQLKLLSQLCHNRDQGNHYSKEAEMRLKKMLMTIYMSKHQLFLHIIKETMLGLTSNMINLMKKHGKHKPKPKLKGHTL